MEVQHEITKNPVNFDSVVLVSQLTYYLAYANNNIVITTFLIVSMLYMLFSVCSTTVTAGLELVMHTTPSTPLKTAAANPR